MTNDYISDPHLIEEIKGQIFDVLYSLLLDKDTSKAIIIPIMVKIPEFVYKLEHVRLTADWIDPSTNDCGIDFSNAQKYQLLKRVFEEPAIAKDFKEALLLKVIGDDKSELAEDTRL